MEDMSTDESTDRPQVSPFASIDEVSLCNCLFLRQEPLKLLAAKVFVDPFTKASEQLQKERDELTEKKAKEAADEAKAIQEVKQRIAGKKGVYESSYTSQPGCLADTASEPKRTGVGRYLQQTKSSSAHAIDNAVVEEPRKKKLKALRSELSDFSAW